MNHISYSEAQGHELSCEVKYVLFSYSFPHSLRRYFISCYFTWLNVSDLSTLSFSSRMAGISSSNRLRSQDFSRGCHPSFASRTARLLLFMPSRPGDLGPAQSTYASGGIVWGSAEAILPVACKPFPMTEAISLHEGSLSPVFSQKT